jgi:hypothetical protein
VRGFWGAGCGDCPAHAFCDDNCTAPETSPGFWRVPWRAEKDAETRLKCLSASACRGPTATDPNTTEECAPHHRGPLCAACAPAAYRVTGTHDCVRCHDDESMSAVFVALLVVGVIVVIGVVTALTLADGGQAAAVDVVVAKITMNHFVIASAAATFPLRWPAFLKVFMSVMSVLSASAMGESSFSIDCVVRGGGMRPVQAWGLATVLAPPTLVGAAAALWCLLRRARHVRVTALIILVLGHPTICKGAFALLSCRFVGDRPFLEADLAVSCSSAEYFAWGYGLGLPSLLLYGAGIPVYYFFKMRGFHRAGTLEAQRAVYGFLFSGYDAERWWYELWNSVRKAVFTGLTILLTPMGAAMQAWGALLLLVGFIVVFLRAEPYREGWLNLLERDALSVDALTLFFGLALFLNDTNTTDARSDGLAMTLSLVIVVINVWFVVRVAWCLKVHSAYGGALRRGTRKVGRRVSMLRQHIRRRTTTVSQSQVSMSNPVVEMQTAL